MLFNYYLKEFKNRFFYCFLSFSLNFIVWLNFSKEILFLLVKPLLKINGGSFFSYFIFTNMTDILLLYFKIALIFSFIFTIPILFLELWFFLIEGLYTYEKNFLIFLFVVGFLFLVFVNLFLYKYFIPFIWFFLTNFELNSSNSLFGLYYEARITDYVDFMFYIFFIFSCFLQFPILMIIFLYFGILNVNFFVKFRKFFYIFFVILGGLLTPPDIFSQLIIFFFVVILYEIILFFGLLFNVYTNEKDQEEILQKETESRHKRDKSDYLHRNN